MKVTPKIKPIMFSRLAIGGVFRTFSAGNEVIAMKTESKEGDRPLSSINAVSLQTGQLLSFTREQKVVPLEDAELLTNG